MELLKQKIKRSLPASLRTHAGERRYQMAKRVGDRRPLVDETRIKEWEYWALIENRFPYDMAFEVHHMLIPKRVVTEDKLNENERKELQKVLAELSDEYDSYLVNFTSKQTVLDHYHIHMLIWKTDRKEMKF